MIVLAAAMLMAGSAAPAAPFQERRAYGQCLTKFVHDKLSGDKMDANAFKAAAKTACATQQTTFRNAWISYDVAMKTRRSDAEQNADAQIDDYLQNSTDSYVDSTTPAKPKAAETPPVKQASSTTPPVTQASGVTPPVTQASSTTPPKP